MYGQSGRAVGVAALLVACVVACVVLVVTDRSGSLQQGSSSLLQQALDSVVAGAASGTASTASAASAPSAAPSAAGDGDEPPALPEGLKEQLDKVAGGDASGSGDVSSKSTVVRAAEVAAAKSLAGINSGGLNADGSGDDASGSSNRGGGVYQQGNDPTQRPDQRDRALGNVNTDNDNNNQFGGGGGGFGDDKSTAVWWTRNVPKIRHSRAVPEAIDRLTGKMGSSNKNWLSNYAGNSDIHDSTNYNLGYMRGHIRSRPAHAYWSQNEYWQSNNEDE